MNTKTIVALGALALAAGAGGAALYDVFRSTDSPTSSWNESSATLIGNRPALVSSTDFSAAAEMAVNAVVHVKTSVEQ